MDLLLAGYLSIVSRRGAGCARRRSRAAGGCSLAHALFGVLLYLVTRPGLGPVGRTIREIYPLLLLAGLYGELDVLNGLGGHGRCTTPLVQRWELALFGAQLSAEWWRAMPSRFWSTVLHAAYLSYYLIVVSPAFYFVWRRDLACPAPLRAGR